MQGSWEGDCLPGMVHQRHLLVLWGRAGKAEGSPKGFLLSPNSSLWHLAP